MDMPEAEIISVNGNQAIVRVASIAGCARCAAGRGCGAGLLSQGLPYRDLRLSLPTGRQFAPGDQVRLAMAPARLLRACCYAYGLPLLALTLVPLAAHLFLGPLDDLSLVALAAGAVAVAVLAGRRLLRRQQCLQQLEPRILGRRTAGAP